MSNYAITYHYPNQIGGIIIDSTDRDNEYSFIISRETDHTAGAHLYILDEFQGDRVYERNVPATPEWETQALEDIRVLMLELAPGQDVYIHIEDEHNDEPDWREGLEEDNLE